MSYQTVFRLGLGENAMAQPLPPHLMPNHQQSTPQGPQFQQTTSASPTGTNPRAPYGSGDHDDGYSLVFPSLEAFHAWREQEEETQMVEFVKGDTHGSKAVPPRFKDHTKLVCARHSRSGRKKYVKKHPERVRKVPSRKIEGQGCSASISFKTYFDIDEVRACYNNQHSHEIGLANLPYTRRGRKAAVQQEKTQSKRTKNSSSGTPVPMPVNAAASASTSAPMYQLPHPFPAPSAQSNTYQPTPYGFAPQLHQQQQQQQASQERWDRMSVLFESIRTHARGFEYPMPSVVALESLLIRLYLESPVGAGVQGMVPPPPPHMQMVNGHGHMQHPLGPPQNGRQAPPQQNGHENGNPNADMNGNGVEDDDDGEDNLSDEEE
ncbi:hypothetical protein FIBSPDRAFT_1041560 [Athelia psychrophila]|uniref:Uncharacterized protein n=1 Tax=Athelia psychrophila TaxID=1759441 RepID=A0A166NVL5_9AGAM|nr:hypothetical protein FIBSPDRAFT_1041560 [Fibularhizoctonia sp. CBS 109695]